MLLQSNKAFNQDLEKKATKDHGEKKDHDKSMFVFFLQNSWTGLFINVETLKGQVDWQFFSGKGRGSQVDSIILDWILNDKVKLTDQE